MKLFGHPDSGHAFKVRLMLSVAGVKHDYECVDIFAPRANRSAEFRQYARFSEVPLLLDGDIPIVQSNVILLYLARQYNGFGADTDEQRINSEEWLFWEANKLGMCLPQLRSYYRFGDPAINDGALAWLKARYAHDIDILEHELSDGRNWILGGDSPGVADFSLCGYLYFADEARVDVPARVQAWLNRLARCPGWQHPYDLMR